MGSVLDRHDKVDGQEQGRRHDRPQTSLDQVGTLEIAQTLNT
jgi:hypothetical protein